MGSKKSSVFALLITIGLIALYYFWAISVADANTKVSFDECFIFTGVALYLPALIFMPGLYIISRMRSGETTRVRRKYRQGDEYNSNVKTTTGHYDVKENDDVVEEQHSFYFLPGDKQSAFRYFEAGWGLGVCFLLSNFILSVITMLPYGAFSLETVPELVSTAFFADFNPYPIYKGFTYGFIFIGCFIVMRIIIHFIRKSDTVQNIWSKVIRYSFLVFLGTQILNWDTVSIFIDSALAGIGQIFM